MLVTPGHPAVAEIIATIQKLEELGGVKDDLEYVHILVHVQRNIAERLVNACSLLVMARPTITE